VVRLGILQWLFVIAVYGPLIIAFFYLLSKGVSMKAAFISIFIVVAISMEYP
jgi:hypothetical protein